MGFMIPLMLFGWIPLTILLFYVMPPRRAVYAAIIFGYLFLPQAAVRLPGLPDYNKAFACIYGVFIAAMIFDSDRLLSFRLRWIDLPMVLYCICPAFSSFSNELGGYDAASAVVAQTLAWGLPYYLGRIYLNSLDALREFSLWVFIGALVYIPFCLVEMRFSPQFHRWVYGFHSSAMMHNIRNGGYRPVVFMQSGLALGLYMACAVLCGLGLYKARLQRYLWGFDMFWLIGAVLATTLLVKAVGAILLLLMAIGALYTSRWSRTALPLIALVLIAPAYSTLRGAQWWDGKSAVDAASVLSTRRAASLEFRLKNENILIEKALQNPYYGWGRWGRSRVFDKNGKDISITDGMWVIVLGETGIVGLVAITAAFALPPLVLLRRHGVRMLDIPALAPAVVWLVMCGLYAIDNQLNAMHNPVFMLGLGGTAAMCTLKMRIAPRTAAGRAQTAAANRQARKPVPQASPAPPPGRIGGRPPVLRSPGAL